MAKIQSYFTSYFFLPIKIPKFKCNQDIKKIVGYFVHSTVRTGNSQQPTPVILLIYLLTGGCTITRGRNVAFSNNFSGPQKF